MKKTVVSCYNFLGTRNLSRRGEKKDITVNLVDEVNIVVSSSYFGMLIVVFSVLLCNRITYIGEVAI